MSRIVWSVGVGGLALALLAAPWLSQPGDSAAAGPVATEPHAESAVAPPTATPPPSPQAADLPPPHPDSVASSAVHASSPLLQPDTSRSARRWPLTSRSLHKLPEQRQRIVSALRGRYATPLERRDAVLAAFESSGESQAEWTKQGREALATWRSSIEEQVLPIRAEPPRCYAAGCVTRVTFPDPASYEEARQRVPMLELTGVGPHMQLPPEYLPSGEVSVSWAVLPPER
ncbi:hypothetical protein [Cystobacter ferrugineus]|uniref:Uncharacterized protein n=1 Tax=Cystobacter ferrugineus TaxID=83449 RepID=A0A1L9BH99_9BACT|nr:hypothetical protein [Cystobacter ferrugineus]OJH41643.1 hypothetical protein BON30_10345 [Cystobacter ferrugineus]